MEHAKEPLFPALKKGVETLFPAYFALVMATGIVSIACNLLGFHLIAKALFYFNATAYCILLVMFFSRVIFYFRAFSEDFSSHAKSPGFLTIVAGTCVLGNQFIALGYGYDIATVLYYLGILLWLILLYALMIVLTTKNTKPTLDQGINGIWLLIVVSTQSISVLGTELLEHTIWGKQAALLISLLMFLLGCIFYIIIITLIFYRLTFFKMKAEEFAPPYWINMGAVAISSLAGALLIQKSAQWEFLSSIQYFVTGMTLMLWAFGTWWIPIIVFLGFWRHVLKQYPLSYHPQYWGMVFPLGMYTVSTYRISQIQNLEMQSPIASGFIYLAVIAWSLTFIGLFHKTIKGLISR